MVAVVRPAFAFTLKPFSGAGKGDKGTADNKPQKWQLIDTGESQVYTAPVISHTTSMTLPFYVVTLRHYFVC